MAASASAGASEAGFFEVRPGIAEIDSYEMLFYGHYPKYCERAANACLPSHAACALLQRAEVVKYTQRVKWNDAVRIKSTRVDGESTLLHEWFIDTKLVHVCLASYTIRGADAFDAPLADKRTMMRIGALRKEGAQLFAPPASSYRRDLFTVYPDMLGGMAGGSALGLPTVMDFFERQRTEYIGGQAELERLKASEGILIVVYTIQQLELHAVASIAPRQQIEVSSGVTIEHGKVYCVHQSVRSVATNELLAQAHIKLVFVKDGQVVPAPEAVLNRLDKSSYADVS